MGPSPYLDRLAPWFDALQPPALGVMAVSALDAAVTPTAQPAWMDVGVIGLVAGGSFFAMKAVYELVLQRNESHGPGNEIERLIDALSALRVQAERAAAVHEQTAQTLIRLVEGQSETKMALGRLEGVVMRCSGVAK